MTAFWARLTDWFWAVVGPEPYRPFEGGHLVRLFGVPVHFGFDS